tara:strand:+ start:1812 stop:2072 length:261 start_codon:yes stop_codon:yes gene_type:complete
MQSALATGEAKAQAGAVTEGTIRKLGLEGGLWALVTDDGRSIELIDCPEALKKNGARARVRGSRESAEVTIGMVGDAMTVDSFELL